MKSWLRLPLIFALVWCVSRSALYFLPGDPAEFLVHESLVEISPSDLRQKMELGVSPLKRIFSFPKSHSLVRNESAITLLGRASRRSLILTLLTLSLSLPLTFLSLFITFQKRAGSVLIHTGILILASTPVFIAGPLFLRIAPLSNPILPAIVLALHLTAFWHRTLSKQLERELPLSSVAGARALGFPEVTVFRKNLLAPSLGKFIAFFGTQLGILLNGSLLVEVLFQWHGVGSLLAESVLSRDYPVIEITLMAVALITLVTQQLGYFLQNKWDPRVT
jgi:peptide/nickel transport system permease protein